MQARHTDELVPESSVRLKYFCESLASLCVLSDEATVVGINSADVLTVLKQSISDHSAPIVAYDTRIASVFTLAADEPKNALFVGGFNYSSGRIVQCNLSSGRVIRDYGDVGIGDIMSSASFGRLRFFGGGESFRFGVIDAQARRVAHEPLATAVEFIHSVAVCEVGS